jgi:hypothetical protein
LAEKERKAMEDELKAQQEGAAAERAERKRRLAEAKKDMEEWEERFNDIKDEITLGMETLALETDDAVKETLSIELRDNKDRAAGIEGEFDKARDTFLTLEDEDKRIEEEEAEAKNNAAMETKLKDARDLMSSAQATFREYKEQIEHL